MKKIVIFLIFLIVISAFSACKKDNISGETDKYFIFILDNLLVKINAKTAVSTTVCQDPLCDHSDMGKLNCPFYCDSGGYSVTESGNIIYFYNRISEIDQENTSTTYYQVNQYNLLTGELKTCYKTKNILTSNIAYKEDYYFTEISYDKNDKGETLKFTDFCKITEDNRISKLNRDRLDNDYFIKKIENDYLYYFIANDPSKVYIRTLDFKEIKETEVKETKKERKFQYETDPNTKYEIIKSAKNNAIITDKACLSFEIGDYVYYTKYRDEKEFIIEDTVIGRKYYNGLENKFYRAKYDGSENEEFCDFGNHLFPYYLNNYNYKGLLDNYCLVRFAKYIKQDDDSVYLDFEYAILNLDNGEYKMVT